FPDEVDILYNLFGIQEEELVEKLSLSRIRSLTPAENPYEAVDIPERLLNLNHPANTIDDDDDDDDDLADEEVEDLDLEEDDVADDASDDDIDDDIDLDLDDDDEDDDDLL